jgi:hypothetical protein
MPQEKRKVVKIVVCKLNVLGLYGMLILYKRELYQQDLEPTAGYVMKIILAAYASH